MSVSSLLLILLHSELPHSRLRFSAASSHAPSPPLSTHKLTILQETHRYIAIRTNRYNRIQAKNNHAGSQTTSHSLPPPPLVHHLRQTPPSSSLSTSHCSHLSAKPRIAKRDRLARFPCAHRAARESSCPFAPLGSSLRDHPRPPPSGAGSSLPGHCPAASAA